MKLKGILGSLLFFLMGTNASADEHISLQSEKLLQKLPHLDLEMTGEEYLSALSRISDRKINDRDLNLIIQKGTRLLKWLAHINSFRNEGTKLSLSSATTQVGIPIDQAKESNPDIQKAAYRAFLVDVPAWFRDVVVDGNEFTDTPPTTDEEFIEWGLRLNVIYQAASRWILQEPYLSSYAARKRDDIRGYYFLSRYSNLSEALENYEDLVNTERVKLYEWLVGLCYNGSSTLQNCRSKLDALIANKKSLKSFYDQYLQSGKSRWDSYFQLSSPRRDVVWNASTPNVMTVPFEKQNDIAVQNFLTTNIEDEWKFGNWQLRLKFSPYVTGMTRIEFIPGATPHVNGLGGSMITMDANQPLTEYNVQWTIRHEYGHVLGLPDCYVEYYDEDRKVMVNYQIDITNIMCSRRGHINQSHYETLKKAYFK